jgi:hypothetical protein
MSDDAQTVVAHKVAPNPPATGKAEADTHQGDLPIADEKSADTVTGDASPVDASNDAEPGEDEAGDRMPSVAMPATREAAVEDPYDFDHCTIQIGLQLLPDDGDPAGRAIVIGVRNHADAPIVALTRLATLGPLPQVVTELLERLRADLPERKTAREQTAVRKRTQEEAARAGREAATAKPGPGTASPAPRRVKGLAQAPESGPAAPKAPVVSVPTFDAPQASEQIALF